jgi:hypothetical protein
VDLKETRYEDVDWIHLAQVSIQWCALHDKKLTFRASKKRQSSWTAEQYQLLKAGRLRAVSPIKNNQ